MGSSRRPLLSSTLPVAEVRVCFRQSAGRTLRAMTPIAMFYAHRQEPGWGFTAAP